MEGMSNRTHGKVATYNDGCRCEPCKGASTVRARNMRQRHRELVEQGSDLVPHGQPSTYGNWGCACERCHDAWNLAHGMRFFRKYGSLLGGVS